MNTLDNWIIGNEVNKREVRYKYFYLEWIDTKAPKELSWKSEMPPDCNIIKEILVYR